MATPRLMRLRPYQYGQATGRSWQNSAEDKDIYIGYIEIYIKDILNGTYIVGNLY